MKHVYWSITLLTVLPTPLFAGFLDCICGSTAEKETITTIRVVEAPKLQKSPNTHPITQPDTHHTLPVPTPGTRPSITTSAMQHVRSTVVATPISAELSTLRAPPSTPQALSLPSTPVYAQVNSFEASLGFPLHLSTSSDLAGSGGQAAGLSPITPVTPISDSSPSSPESPLALSHDESPLVEEGRIITYPAKILAVREHDRYLQATALAQAFKKDLLIMHNKQQKIAWINADIYEARVNFANEITEHCATHSIDDFPCTFDCRDGQTGNTKSLTLNEGQYADLRELGSRVHGRLLTSSEVVRVFNIIPIPEKFRLEEFIHSITYKHSTYEHSERVHTLVIEKARFDTLNELIPKQLPLSAEQAKDIIDAIRVKLGGPARSLKQSMICKSSPEAREQLEEAEAIKPLSLAESIQILDPHFKPLAPLKDPRSLQE